MKFLTEPLDNGSDERNFGCRIGNPQCIDVALCANGGANLRPFVGQFNFDSHGFDGNKDVGKENHGINPEDSVWLKRNLGSEICILAEVEERDLRTNFAIFLKVAAR